MMGYKVNVLGVYTCEGKCDGLGPEAPGNVVAGYEKWF